MGSEGIPPRVDNLDTGSRSGQLQISYGGIGPAIRRRPEALQSWSRSGAEDEHPCPCRISIPWPGPILESWLWKTVIKFRVLQKPHGDSTWHTEHGFIFAWGHIRSSFGVTCWKPLCGLRVGVYTASRRTLQIHQRTSALVVCGV
jgi:hypothetical protein